MTKNRKSTPKRCRRPAEKQILHPTTRKQTEKIRNLEILVPKNARSLRFPTYYLEQNARLNNVVSVRTCEENKKTKNNNQKATTSLATKNDGGAHHVCRCWTTDCGSSNRVPHRESKPGFVANRLPLMGWKTPTEPVEQRITSQNPPTSRSSATRQLRKGATAGSLYSQATTYKIRATHPALYSNDRDTSARPAINCRG